MKNRPLVSVIIPVYNCVKFIDEAIDSIISQTYSKMEIFIIDDCSSDGTKEKVEQWAEIDKRIKPIYKTANTGYVESLNTAISMSSGEYVARMDGDDLSLPERIEKQVEFLEINKNIDVVGSKCLILGTNKVIQPQTDHDKISIGLLTMNQMCHPTIMFRSNKFKVLNFKYKTDYIPAEDYELWTRMIMSMKFANIDEVLLHYRLHGGNISIKHKDNGLINKIIKNQLLRLNNDLTDGFVLDFNDLTQRQYTPRTVAEGFDFLQKIHKLSIQNKKTKIYNYRQFNKFIFINSFIVIQCIGWKTVVYCAIRSQFQFLFKIPLIILLKTLNPRYDYCRCEWQVG